ncbi:MAG: tetratricopeptide repeat protein [Verrucomicrobiota bacterium]|nr:tetratricopeptide repeat protein [Verrucomicrobiota bacterium]
MMIVFLLIPSLLFCAAPSLPALYASLDPSSVAEHFAFYELYPQSREGKEALRHAWSLLSRGESEADPSLRFPELELTSLLALVNRSNEEEHPFLLQEQLAAIERLGKVLGNRKLKGHQFWNVEEILPLSSEEIDLSRGLLVAELGDQREKIRSFEASLDLMALQILARLPQGATHQEIIRKINDYIFSEMEFRFPPHSLYAKDIDLYTFLPSVLESRRGVCLGVSILYLCLAQRLELPMEIITPPGHIFVRYVDAEGTITNIETTARGLDIPTEHYLGIETPALQNRTTKEVIGLAFMNQAAVSWQNEQYSDAIALYEKALLFLPEDYLAQLFLSFNYWAVGEEKKAKSLLEKIQGKAPEALLSNNSLVEDLLAGRTDISGVQALFSEVNESRESILKKQQELLRITEKFPLFRQGIFHLAITWLQLGREKEALPILERLAALDAGNATVHYYLSAIALQRHHFPKAWTHLHSLESLLTARGYRPRAFVALKKELASKCPDPL